ncbi:hypothetical protein [Pseudanabaena sp. 'Roaring Creek']|uniref:hypothetical protein n=1 Tax=Pseudanabaena sp. 'Roaring Creek' TaxID=1681830 RepID=UPI0012E1690E|nr:hypothetical protein [Pseudanabaena sp. 'Roaring Creek']
MIISLYTSQTLHISLYTLGNFYIACGDRLFSATMKPKVFKKARRCTGKLSAMGSGDRGQAWQPNRSRLCGSSNTIS